MNPILPGKDTRELKIDQLHLKKASLILRAVNHRLRQQVLHHLHQEGETSVSDLYQTLHLEQSVASNHLAILRRAGAVVARREGKHVLYSLNYSRLDELMTFAGALLN